MTLSHWTLQRTLRCAWVTETSRALTWGLRGRACGFCSRSQVRNASVSKQAQKTKWQSNEPDQLLRAAIEASESDRLNSQGPSSSGTTFPWPSQNSSNGRQRKTGAFQQLPHIPLADDHLRTACNRANRIQPNQKLKNKFANAKNLAARRLDALAKELTVPLGKMLSSFPVEGSMHPFEIALLDLTIGLDSYSKRLKKMDNLRRSCLELGKSHAGKAAKANNTKEAQAVMAEGFEAVEAAFEKGKNAMESVKELTQKLRRLHTVDPKTPSVVLVGAPNVGKSSLVQVLSSGLPEICDYPFTTKTVKMGHFYLNGQKRQVTDTPGVLDRKDEDRNAMERLTLACLEHLSTVVIFVFDLTEDCGSSVDAQWNIRQDLRSRFVERDWVDVFTKADLLQHILQPQALKDSEVRNDEYIVRAGKVIEALPEALRISSMTQEGIPALQNAVMRMLTDLEDSSLPKSAASCLDEPGIIAL